MTNKDWIKNTTLKESDLNCECSGVLQIYHVSNWHNGTGLFYTKCGSCETERNIKWKSKSYETV